MGIVYLMKLQNFYVKVDISLGTAQKLMPVTVCTIKVGDLYY